MTRRHSRRTVVTDDPKTPGQETTCFRGYARWSGTSFAAATVTGAIAARTSPDESPARTALTELVAGGGIVTPYTGAS